MSKPDLDDFTPDLPELDGDDDDAGGAEELDEELPAVPADDGDPFDDAAAEGLVDEWAGLSAADDEAGAAEEDEREVDIGEVELDAGDRESGLLVDADEPGVGDEALDIDEPPAGFDDDGGAEGFADLADEALDEKLPELDADDDGDAGDSWLIAGTGELGLEEGHLPRWADVAWSVSSERLGLGVGEAEALALAFSAPACALVTHRGALLVSADGGETFASKDAWRALVGRGDGLAHVGLGRGGREVHLLSHGGTRLASADGGATFRRIERSELLALTTAPDGSIVAVGADPSRGLELLVSGADPAHWSVHELPAPVIPIVAAPNPVVAATTRAIALGSESGLAVSRDGGGSFAVVPGCAGTVAVAFAGEGDDAPLVAAVYREAEDRTFLVRVTVDGLAEVVGDVSAPAPAGGDDDLEALGRAAALAWDAPRGLLWVAGPVGIVPLKP